MTYNRKSDGILEISPDDQVTTLAARPPWILAKSKIRIPSHARPLKYDNLKSESPLAYMQASPYRTNPSDPFLG